MKKILFFDATNQWILAETFLFHEDETVERKSFYSGIHPKESSKLLIQELRNVLITSDWTKPDLIAAALGPGSFTGLRIAVATARNLAQLWSIPALGFDSLNVYTSYYFREAGDPVVVAIEAKQKKIGRAHV